MTYKTQYPIEDQEKKRKLQKKYSMQLDKPEDKNTWRPVLSLIERGEPKLAVTSGRPRRYVQGGVLRTIGEGGFQAARAAVTRRHRVISKAD
jgi:hypothetical protein